MGNAADRMEENLWLGDRWSYEYPDYNKKFQVIVTALLDAEVRDYRIKEQVAGRPWLHVPIDDAVHAEISRHFLEVIQFIDTARKQGQCVFVHCAAGVSRSPTLVCAYLMWEHGWTRKQAMEYVTARRKIVDPNDGFMDELLAFERVLEEIREKQDETLGQDVEKHTCCETV